MSPLLRAKFESMAEEKRKREEEEKAQQMAKQQQERKALVKMSHEAQQPVATREEPVAPAPLPKKISSEVSARPSGIHIQHSLPRHEGALPPPCIVRKDPRVPHTARRGA